MIRYYMILNISNNQIQSQLVFLDLVVIDRHETITTDLDFDLRLVWTYQLDQLSIELFKIGMVVGDSHLNRTDRFIRNRRFIFINHSG